MSKALIKRGGGSAASGVIPAVASAIVPGVGQLINGETDKAIGVFVVAAVAGWSAVAWLPFVGVIGAATWVYGVADGYLTGRKKG
jgi:hypothetical protein